MKYPVIRTDHMTGTVDPARLVTVVYKDASGKAADINNGCVVALDKITDTDREVWEAKDPAVDAAIPTLAIVATPELTYKAEERNLDDFTNKAGGEQRGYLFVSGNIFSLTDNGFTVEDGVTVEKGCVVELDGSNVLSIPGKEATEGSTQIGQIIDVEVVGTYTYYVVRVA